MMGGRGGRTHVMHGHRPSRHRGGGRGRCTDEGCGLPCPLPRSVVWRSVVMIVGATGVEGEERAGRGGGD